MSIFSGESMASPYWVPLNLEYDNALKIFGNKNTTFMFLILIQNKEVTLIRDFNEYKKRMPSTQWGTIVGVLPWRRLWEGFKKWLHLSKVWVKSIRWEIYWGFSWVTVPHARWVVSCDKGGKQKLSNSRSEDLCNIYILKSLDQKWILRWSCARRKSLWLKFRRKEE